MSESVGKLAAALVEFQKDLPSVNKGRKANVGSYSYSYADLADCSRVAMPLLSKHGLAFSACPQHTESGYELVGVLMHTSGESLSGALPILGRTAQEIGSSITYNRRYLLGSLTGLVTDDDDDGALANQAKPRSRGEDQTKRPADPLLAAKREVKAAWESAHSGAWSKPEMERAFEEWASLPIGDADAETLITYAKHLRGQ